MRPNVPILERKVCEGDIWLQGLMFPILQWEVCEGYVCSQSVIIPILQWEVCERDVWPWVFGISETELFMHFLLELDYLHFEFRFCNSQLSTCIIAKCRKMNLGRKRRATAASAENKAK